METAAAGSDGATLYDIASLTKVVATASLARIAAAEGLDWSRRVGDYWPAFRRTRFEDIRVEHLATHTSGLPAWRPLYASGLGAEAYRRALAALEPEAKPGTVVVYSDLGMLVFGEVLETVLSAPVDQVFREQVALPAGASARYGPVVPPESAAPTEEGNRYEKNLCEEMGYRFGAFRISMIRGEVHDANAFYRGGVAAHAGVFATGEDVWKLVRGWLSGGGEYTEDRTAALPESRGLFWQRKRGAGSAIPAFSDRAFGHTGFTGTSVWVDPERERIWILLTNRVHPVIAPIDFNEVRRRFHEAAIDS